MTGGPRNYFVTALLLLPLFVAALGWSFWTALLLVLALLAARWLLVVASIGRGGNQPKVVLESIAMSHFVEKVRWCMDRLGVDYHEQKCAGLLGVVFTGRTVPRLKFRSGIVQSSIGHSPEILRYLWGEHYVSAGDRAAFLEPTEERLELEKRIDRYGVDLQVWVYYQMLPHRGRLVRVWGAYDPEIPWWQRQLMQLLYPALAFFLRRTFQITDEHYMKAVEHIGRMLGDVEALLEDGRTSLLGGDDVDYVDITFAAISGLWQQPVEYAGGRADACRLPEEEFPPAFQADVARWRKEYPLAAAFISRLYAEERLSKEQAT